MELADADIDGILAKVGIVLAEPKHKEFVEGLNQAVSAYFRDALYKSLRPPPSKVVIRLRSIRKAIKNEPSEYALHFLGAWQETAETVDREARKAILRWWRLSDLQESELKSAADNAVKEYEGRVARGKSGELETGPIDSQMEAVGEVSRAKNAGR